MTMWTLHLTSIVGRGLAAIIVALSGAALGKPWGVNTVVATLIGLGE